VAINAPTGADVFVISLYDAPQATGETSAAGNELGRVRLTQTIVANTTNTLTATLIGTVAAIRIGPLPNQSNVLPVAGSSPAAYELVGRAPATFAVAPLDTDGNVIVQPDAPPAISLGPNIRATGILNVTPVSGTTDQFTVQSVAPNATTYPTALAATATDANGNVATSSTIVDATSAVYVAYANGGTPAIARYDPHGTLIALPAGAFPGLGNPVALAYDPDDREILVADAAVGKILAFDETGVPLAAFSAPAIAGVNGVVYDPHNGNVYASGSGGVTVFSPSGGAPNGGVPASFAVPNAQGIAFVATSATSVLNRIVVGSAAATPALRFYSESGSAAGSVTLSAGPIGVAYAAPAGPGQVPQTTAQLYVTTASGVLARDAFGAAVAAATDAGSPFGIAVDPNLGSPLVTERGANALTGYLDDLSAVDAARTFATPAARGRIQPQGVCHVF
jgi:sugar lactone lactonase YvrE